MKKKFEKNNPPSKEGKYEGLLNKPKALFINHTVVTKIKNSDSYLKEKMEIKWKEEL